MRGSYTSVSALVLVLCGCPNAAPDAQKFAAPDALTTVDSGSLDTGGVDAASEPDAAGDAAAAETSGGDLLLPPDVPPADVPPADVPPADVPPADVPPADVPPADVPPVDAGCVKNGCPDGNPCQIATCEDTGACVSGPKADGSGCGANHTCYSGICLPDPPKAKQVVTGGDTTCARLDDGSVRCWGYGHYGQLGDGKFDNGYKSAAPIVVQGVTGATDLSCGGNHCCAVVTGGKVKCWGGNDQGQCSPTASKVVQAKAIDVPGVTASQVAAGEYHTCALIVGGKVQCWGLGTVGQLGDGNGNIPGKVVNVAWSGYATEVRAGQHFNCARTAQGQAFCWGSNQNGQIGDGQGGTSKEADLPAQVGVLSDVLGLGAGDQHACAVVKNGDVQCWGHESSFQLGNGGQNIYYSTPQLAGVGGAVQVAAGGAHTCAVLGGDIVSCWGANQRGQAGQGNSAQTVKNPTVVPDLEAIASVAAGSQHTCARGLDGSVWCWGANDSGQCGSGPKDQWPAKKLTL